MTGLSEGYQQAEALRLQQAQLQQTYLEQQRQAGKATSEISTIIKSAAGSEAQQFAAGEGSLASRTIALDAKVKLVDATQKVNQSYADLSTRVDIAIDTQRSIIDAAKITDFDPASMSKATENLDALKQQKNDLDNWYKDSTKSLSTYNAQINLIAGGAGGAEYVIHKGDTYVVTYIQNGETKTEKFTNKYDADQFAASLQPTAKPGEKYILTYVERNPAVLLSNLIQRGGSAIDAWISSGETTPDKINNYVWGNLAKGAYSFINMFDPANYVDVMQGIASLPTTLPPVLSEWASLKPAIFKIMGDEVPPLYERMGAWVTAEPDVIAWMSQKPRYDIALQIAGSIATGYVIGGLFTALDAAPPLTAAEKLELLRSPPLLKPKLMWGEYPSLMGADTVDELTALAKSTYGFESGLVPYPPSMPRFIRSQLKWGTYPSLTQMKTIENIALKLSDYVYVDSDFSYPGYTLMKMKDPDGMYRLYLQTGADLIEVPQESLIARTRVTTIPKYAHFSLDDYNNILDDLRASTDPKMLVGFKPYSLEDWNQVVESIIKGKRESITIIPPISLFKVKADVISDPQSKAAVITSLKMTPLTEAAIITALATVQIYDVPQITSEVVDVIQNMQLDQYVSLDTINDLMIDTSTIRDVKVPEPTIKDVEPVPPPEPVTPEPPRPPKPPEPGEPKPVKPGPPKKKEEKREEAERRGVVVGRFRVVLDGRISTVAASSFVEALSRVSGGRGRRATVTRLS